jgi:hypothetical protein
MFKRLTLNSIIGETKLGLTKLDLLAPLRQHINYA